jgi:hypothetical protein
VRIHAIDTCPLWEEPDGSRRVGMAYERDHPPVVGWVNVLDVDIGGVRYQLLLTLAAADA